MRPSNIARFSIGPHTIQVQDRCDPKKQWFPMSYKVMDEEVDAVIDDWTTAWREPISANEVSIGPPDDAPVDPVRRTDQQRQHDSDGESSTNTPTNPEAQHILKDIRTRRIMEQDASTRTRSMMEAQI